MRSVIFGVLTSVIFCGAYGQPAFEVASIKPSKSIVGHDGNITTDPGRFTARNSTLKQLIFEAYRVPYSQITGGPAWIDSNEYDVDAKPEGRASVDQLRLMLRALLTDRFKLAIRNEMKERRVYALTVGKDGPRLRNSGDETTAGKWRFHGTLSEFANYLAIQLTIPLLDDPTVPSHATGAPVPVLDKTGIEGTYDLRVDIKPDRGGDAFTIWQRALQEQLGLKLESQRAPVETLIIEHAEKIPTEN
jgi:uncharacterized protein (TIGR03435 family)